MILTAPAPQANFPFAGERVLREGFRMEPVMPRETGLDARFEAELRAAVPGWRSGPGGVRHDAEARRLVWDDPQGTSILEYERTAEALVVTHTFVPEALRGTGRAGTLMREAQDLARQEKLALQATCSYAEAWLARQRGDH